MSTDEEPEEANSGDTMNPFGRLPGMTPPQPITNSLSAEAPLSTFTLAHTDADCPMNPVPPRTRTLFRDVDGGVEVSALDALRMNHRMKDDAKLPSNVTSSRANEPDGASSGSNDDREGEDTSDVSTDIEGDELKSDDKWFESLREFKRYKEEHGDGNVPQKTKLGRWVNKVSWE